MCFKLSKWVYRIANVIPPHILFLPGLVYTCVRSWWPLGNRKWYSRIDDTLILGSIPFGADYTKSLIESEGVTAVLSLNEEFELDNLRWFNWNRYLTAEEWNSLGVRWKCIPSPDLSGPPSLEVIQKGVEFLKEQSLKEGTTYVHCKAGRRRSCAIVLAYLMEREHCSPKEAAEIVRSKRGHVIIREAEFLVLRDYQAILGETFDV